MVVVQRALPQHSVDNACSQGGGGGLGWGGTWALNETTSAAISISLDFYQHQKVGRVCFCFQITTNYQNVLMTTYLWYIFQVGIRYKSYLLLLCDQEITFLCKKIFDLWSKKICPIKRNKICCMIKTIPNCVIMQPLPIPSQYNEKEKILCFAFF